MNLRDKLERIKVERRKDDNRATLQQWLQDLELLVSTLESWMKPYVDDGLLELSRRMAYLNEERSGPYKAPGLEIRAGPLVVHLRPKARWVIGSFGRVDLYTLHHPGRYILVRVTEGGPVETSWRLRRSEGESLEPFKKEAFERILEGWLQ